MGLFVTEDWLRANYSLSDGTEIHLPVDCRLTPAARTLISDHHLVIKYLDEQGRLYVEKSTQGMHNTADLTDDAGERAELLAHSGEGVLLKPVHGLTSQDHYEEAACQLCQQGVQQKPDTMTHLNAHTLVSKADPRLAFRAKLDSTIAVAVWLQGEISEEAQGWLSDIRSVLGNIMRADAMDETLPHFVIGGLDEKAIHRLSHTPLPYLEHDHIVPSVEHGRDVRLLNLLRTSIRETEIAAAQIFIDRDFRVTRPDLMQGLNRLSSAVYVLMLLCLRLTQNKPWLSKDALIQALSLKDER